MFFFARFLKIIAPWGGGWLARLSFPSDQGFALAFCSGGGGGEFALSKIPRGLLGRWSGLELTDT